MCKYPMERTKEARSWHFLMVSSEQLRGHGQKLIEQKFNLNIKRFLL